MYLLILVLHFYGSVYYDIAKKWYGVALFWIDEQVDTNLVLFCIVAKGKVGYEDFTNGVKSLYKTTKNTIYLFKQKKRSISLFGKDREIDLYYFYLNKDFMLPFLQNYQNK